MFSNSKNSAITSTALFVILLSLSVTPKASAAAPAIEGLFVKFHDIKLNITSESECQTSNSKTYPTEWKNNECIAHNIPDSVRIFGDGDTYYISVTTSSAVPGQPSFRSCVFQGQVSSDIIPRTELTTKLKLVFATSKNRNDFSENAIPFACEIAVTSRLGSPDTVSVSNNGLCGPICLTPYQKLEIDKAARYVPPTK